MAEQYYATQRLKGDGTTTVWPFSFAGGRPDSNSGTSPYLEPEDVQVAKVDFDLDGNETRTPIDFSLQGQDQVRVIPAIANGQDFVIYRVTNTDTPVADFTDFASISERDLDNALRQTLYSVQELADTSADTRSLASGAVADSAGAVRTAEDAFERADTATSTANTALGRAGTAISTANSATDTAQIADDKADSALQDSATALTQSSEAKQAATSAESKADSAVATADDASFVADNAQTRADNAFIKSQQADSTANAANTKAEAAEITADSAEATANAAEVAAAAAEVAASEAKDDASRVEGFQGQLDTIRGQVQDLTGVDPTAISNNADNLSELTDFAVARANLSVYSKSEVDSSIGTVVQDTETDIASAVQGHEDKPDPHSQYFQKSSVTQIAGKSTSKVLSQKAVTDSFNELGTASGKDVGYFATAAQGRKADNALQDASQFATSAQGSKADNALPRSQVSQTFGQGTSQVPSQKAVTDRFNGLGTAASKDTSYFATSAQGGKADGAVQQNGQSVLFEYSGEGGVEGGLVLRTGNNEAPFILQARSSGQTARFTVTHGAKHLKSDVNSGNWYIDEQRVLDFGDLVQGKGQSTARIMSQKAVTDALASAGGRVSWYGSEWSKQHANSKGKTQAPSGYYLTAIYTPTGYSHAEAHTIYARGGNV